MPWQYKIANIGESRWKGKRHSTGFDTDWPRVGIYCHDPSHQATFWPIGSLVLSREIWESRQQVFWGLRPDYPTGSGRLIRLGYEATDGGLSPQSIVDDRPFDRGAKEAALREVASAIERAAGDSSKLSAALAKSRQVLDDFDSAEARMRDRWPLNCKAPVDNIEARRRGARCGRGHTYRAENMQDVVSRVWKSGNREISLAGLEAARRA